MTKISLSAVIWVWHCVVYGQIPDHHIFDPYHSYYIPYASTLVKQPTEQINAGIATKSSGADEFENFPHSRTFLSVVALSFQMRRLEATTVSLTNKLTALNNNMETKVDQAIRANTAVSTLNVKLQATNDKLATTAQQADVNKVKADLLALDAEVKAEKEKLKNLKAEVEALSKSLTTINAALDNKADKSDLATITTALESKADKTALADKADKTALDAKADKTALADKADKTALDAKADKTALDTINTALNTITSPSSIGTIPTSCGDLKTIGFVKSGIYSVMVNKQVKNVYCDFTKPINAGLEKLIGTVDVQSNPIYFYAQLTSSFSNVNSAVSFSTPMKLNVGNAFTPSTGVFVAPTPGKYYFAFSGVNDKTGFLRVGLQVMKTGTTTWSTIGEAYSGGSSQTCTLHATLDLLKGDQVRLILQEGTIFENANRLTNYVGWLISENELPV